MLQEACFDFGSGNGVVYREDRVFVHQFGHCIGSFHNRWTAHRPEEPRNAHGRKWKPMYSQALEAFEFGINNRDDLVPFLIAEPKNAKKLPS